MCLPSFINNKDVFGFIPVFYFCVFLKKQTFTTEITARYKLQQQTQLSILNTLFSSALSVIVQPVKLPATQKFKSTFP